MYKRRNDYRLTKKDQGISLSRPTEEIIGKLEMVCPLCLERSLHNKIKKHIKKEEWGIQLECTHCGKKRFAGVAGSDKDHPSVVKGKLVKAFKERLWDWVREHIEEVIEFEVPVKINLFKGKVGAPRRHKGKPAYSSNELHQDFLKYLDTPEYVKQLKQALSELERSDPELYDYFFFRAAGYSFKQINDTGHFGQLLKYNVGARKIKSGEYELNKYSLSLNYRVDLFLINSIPRNVLLTFDNTGKAISEILDSVSSTSIKLSSPERIERITCPKCQASDPACVLCRTTKRKWDGTIPRWLFDKYQKRVSSGETWD